MSMMLQQGNSLPTPLPVVGTNDDVLKTIAEVANTLPLDETFGRPSGERTPPWPLSWRKFSSPPHSIRRC